MTIWRGERFRLYSLVDGELHGIAEAPDAQGIGLAMVTIAAENEYEALPTMGILDWHAHRWLTNPGWVTHQHTPFH